jgi:predicted nuclease with TOPRIM domain
METPKPSSSTSPRCIGVSWRSVWGRRLSWLISALSGTLEIEAETERLRQENAQMRKQTEQMRKETEQVRKETEQVRSENARLAELESKIDGLFSKYNIKLPPQKTPEQP